MVAKAHRWFSALSSGQYGSVLAIANEQAMEARDVTRILHLAFLAPDVVQRIVRGEQPMGLSTKRLLAQAPFPLRWDEQRRLLGSAVDSALAGGRLSNGRAEAAKVGTRIRATEKARLRHARELFTPSSEN